MHETIDFFRRGDKITIKVFIQRLQQPQRRHFCRQKDRKNYFYLKDIE